MSTLVFVFTIILAFTLRPQLQPESVSSTDGDQAALLAFKDALSSRGALINWKSDIPHCRWTGVTCSAKHGRVTGIRLDGLGLGGTISGAISNLTYLRRLHLGGNGIGGIIPREIGLLRNLVVLDLKNNALEGDIPQASGFCKNLKDLILHNNKLTGSVPSNLNLCSNIHTISLGKNLLSGEIPNYFSSFKNLHVLSVEFNQLNGKIPISLGNCHSLTQLHLNNNYLSGEIPIELNHLTMLVRLHLQFNHLQGTIPSSMFNFPYMHSLQLGNNFITGELPDDFGNTLPSLTILDLENNFLEGTVPSSISSASNLHFLNLNNNNFKGMVPLGLGNLSFLSTLLLAGNHFHGWGFLDSLRNCLTLEIVDLSNNNFSGFLPNSIRNLPIGLKELRLRGNKIDGPIPTTLMHLKNIQILDMSKNRFLGTIPSYFGGLSNLMALSLANNLLYGEIPSSLGNLTELVELDLSGNRLSGILPTELGMLQKLHLLDLSKNRFTGRIPPFLQSLHSLHFLNLSFNAFEGEVPTEGVFGNPLMFSIIKNEKLCSGNPELGLKKCSSVHRIHLTMFAWVGILVPLATFLLMVSIIFISRNYVRGRQRNDDSSRPSVESQLDSWCGNVPYVNLSNATDGFSPTNLIGSGGFSNVYRGYLEERNMEVAVKVFRPEVRGYSAGFIAECNILRNFYHYNLVKVVTACHGRDFAGRDFKAIVYEYIANGSLDTWLHRRMRRAEGSSRSSAYKTLTIFQRMSILIDVSTALCYLHTNLNPPIVHLDVKPGNILLRRDMTACLGDFGLTSVLSSSTVTGASGTLGYLAPESMDGEPVSTGWDVYSFGIVLLEMFTGKKPSDPMFINGPFLRQYVDQNYPSTLKNILDPSLMEEFQNEEHMDRIISGYLTAVIKIGLQCSYTNPEERMNMRGVLDFLKRIRKDYIDIEKPPNII